MHSTGVSNINFYGTTRYLSCNSEGKSRRVSDCPFGTAYFGESRGLSEFVKKHSFPHAQVEETIGKTHDNNTYRVYVAEPKEIVDDLIKQKHDYIVYDVEPSFPDIRLYFETEQNELKKEFQNVKDYFKRLENSSSSQSNKEILNMSKLKQNIAEICAKIIDEGEDLRTQRSKLENKLSSKYIQLDGLGEILKKYRKELVLKRSAIANQKIKLDVKERGLENTITRKGVLESKRNKKPEEIARANSQIAKYEEAILELKSKIARNQERADFLEQFIEEAPQRILNCEKEIVEIRQQIKNIKEALMPNVKKLKELYTSNGIKIIKRI